MKKEQDYKKKSKKGGGMSVQNPYAAGIDIGGTIHWVAVNDGNGGHLVREFGAFTEDLESIVSFLKESEVTTVAMESTGIYWLPLYVLCQESGLDPYLVNAKHVKNVTGRKKDDTDAIWIQKLHTCGLLQKSFQPEKEMRILRDYTRQRKTLIRQCATSTRRLQKALELMNIKIHTVISDILGKTGMLIVKAILGGERDAEVLYKLCDVRIKASKADIIKSLKGTWSEEYLFMLKQSVESYEFTQKQMKDCESKIEEQLLKQVALVNDGDITAVYGTVTENVNDKNVGKESLDNSKEKVVKKKAKPKKNQYDFNLNSFLISLVCVDLCKIPGISEVTALDLISEIGTDMTLWKSAKQFAAWLNLAPNTKISGGKVLSSKMMHSKNKAGQYLKQAASTLYNSKTDLGEYYRRMKAKLGGKGAVLATAHKLSKIIYKMLSEKVEYSVEVDTIQKEKARLAKIKKVEKLLESLKKAA
jgi:transposase